MSHPDLLLVFLIDDDVEFGEKLNDYLKLNPAFEVKLFTNVEACLQNLSACPNVVIVDYHMDGSSKSISNGMVILEKVKKFDSAIHVIMLTALSHYGVAAQTIAKGAEQCVIKDNEALKNIEMILEDINQERK